MALFAVVPHRPWRSPGAGSRDLGLAELKEAWPKARSYALLLILPTTLSAGVVGLFQISHGAWMATTVLRSCLAASATPSRR